MNPVSASSSACPSQLQLDRLHAGHCDASGAEQLRDHIRNCPVCQAAMRIREQGFAAFGISEQAALARFRNRIEAEGLTGTSTAPLKPGWKHWLTRFSSRPSNLVAACGATAVLAVLLGGPTLSGQESASKDQGQAPAGLRSKGGAGLEVFVSRNGRVQKVTDGARLQEGDRLRFRVSLEKDRQVMIVGREQDGAVYLLAASGDRTSFAVSAGAEQLLDQTVMMDDSVGPESLYLVACPKLFDEQVLNSQGAALTVPNQCDLSVLNIVKVASKRDD